MSQIQKASEIIERAKEEVRAILADSQFYHSQLEIMALFDKILTRFSFMGAALKSTVPSGQQFGPITSFMGDPIKTAKMITPADINPTETAKANFLNRVTRLYAEISSIAPEGLLNSYSLPEDELVIRGVAKRAGIENFSDAPLTIEFIEDIITSIAIKKEEEVKQAEIDADLKKVGGKKENTAGTEGDDKGGKDAEGAKGKTKENVKETSSK